MLAWVVSPVVMNSEPSAAPNRSVAEHCLTAAVVRAIVGLNDTNPAELDVRFADYVDPDALNALFEWGDRTNDGRGTAVVCA